MPFALFEDDIICAYIPQVPRKFRFTPHAAKQRWTSSTPCYALLPSKGFADEPK